MKRKATIDTLSTYRRKRDFRRTPEPEGRSVHRAKNLYVIQKHAASHLHYDLRLELGGVLKSWAIPRGPSLDPSTRRLAVRTEDHPLDYARFEGVIPKGEYGGGSVMVWDLGRWRPLDDPEDGLRRGRLRMDIRGERLHGGFTLVRLPAKDGRKGPEQWLLIKARDRYADTASEPTEHWNTSVISGRNMQAIAGGEPAASARTRPGNAVPRFIAPQLPTLVDAPPDGDEWLHELKHDGYRLNAAFANGDVVLRTRNGLDWSERFAGLLPEFRALNATSGVIDGEVIVEDEHGVSSFQHLQRAIRDGSGALVFVAFDLLQLDGEDLRAKPLVERKRALVELLSGSALRYSGHIVGDGAEVHSQACRSALEGIVSKRANARYRSGRTRSWLKTKCSRRDEFVIGGMRTSAAADRAFASLLVGSHERGALVYRGRVGTGFDSATLADLRRRLDTLVAPDSPFDHVPAPMRRGAVWVRPKLVAEVEYAGLTGAGLLRHARFVGLREDKRAAQVRTAGATTSGERAQRAQPDEASVAGVSLSHPDRVLYPRQGITKRQLALYLETVAEPMLAHVANRPLSLVRCPRGHRDECFFQRHFRGDLPEGFHAVAIKGRDGKRSEYLYLNDVAGLVGGARMNVLEYHVWGVHRDRPDRPDRLVFDLDPGPDVGFGEVRRTAQELREVLQAANLEAYAMLTGGKGLHLVVPIQRRHPWPRVTAFAAALCRELASAAPQRLVATASKAARAGRIYLDWRRNEPGATAVAPFSPRARDGAPVAVPVSWRELERIDRADAYTVHTLPRRLRALRRDPWDGYFDSRQQLSAAAMRAVHA